MRLASRASLLAAALFLVTAGRAASAAPNAFHETDLVSDLPGRAQLMDPHLVNPWGIVPGPTGVLWVSDNGRDVSTLYQPDGTIVPLVVAIPSGAPTGVVVTSAADSGFFFPSGDTLARAIFIFASENGAIDAWTNKLPPATAVTVDSTPGAVYKGLAIAYTGPPTGPRLYVADFHDNRIDVFNSHFLPITLPGSFTDPNLPSGYAPFNVAVINGRVYVAYAKQDAEAHDDAPGAGLGYIDIFATDGTFVRRLVSNGPLNAPWAMVVAPPGFGPFGGDLLVGNFGDGAINAFHLPSGDFDAALRDSVGNPLAIDGLWGLSFGKEVSTSGVTDSLYFAAGLNGEADGLLGVLTATAAPSPACDNQAKGLAFWGAQCAAANAGGDGDHDGDDGGGKGKGHDHGGGKGGDGDDGHGRGPKAHGPKHGFGRFGAEGGAGDHGSAPVSADSLAALFACVSASSPVFGPNGCFTASCDLLDMKGRLTDAQRAARGLLALLLDRCAGTTCDSAAIACNSPDAHTVGEVIAMLEGALCPGGSGADLGTLAQLAACASASRPGSGGAGDGDHDGDDRGKGHGHGGRDVAIVVTTRGGATRLASGAAAEFAISTAAPGLVRLRIVDATGRLVAEPLHGAYVNGSLVVAWDGRDTRGVLVPPGAYFYHATTGGNTAAGKVLVLR